MFVEIAAALISLVIVISLIERYLGWEFFWLAAGFTIGGGIILIAALMFPAPALMIGVIFGVLVWGKKVQDTIRLPPDWRLVEDAKEEWRRRKLGKRIV